MAKQKVNHENPVELAEAAVADLEAKRAKTTEAREQDDRELAVAIRRSLAATRMRQTSLTR
jgi:hypothetical protein